MDLADLSRKLVQATQGDISLKEETATALQQFISDPQDTRAGVMCIVEALRVFAPEPPIPREDFAKVFRFLIQELWLVHDVTRIRFVEDMLKKLVAVHGYLLFLHSECLLDEVFKTIYEVFTTPFNGSGTPELVPCVVKMMISLVNETSRIPPDVLHRIFHHLEGDTFLRKISRSILHGLETNAVAQVNYFVESEWLTERGDSHLAQDVLLRIFEAYKIKPELVHSVIPRLEDELRRIDPVRRITATDLVGKMAALPRGDIIPTEFPRVWDAYVERFDDVVNDVRHSCTKRVCELVQNHPSASSTARVLERCEARLLDKNKNVRLEMILSISTLCIPDLGSMKIFLPHLFRRCRDKQRAVRAAALTSSVNIYLAHRGDSCVHDVPSHIFASLFLSRSDKDTRIVEECAERLFQPTNDGVPACMFAFRAKSGGLNEVAQHGLLSFSQTKTLARRAVLRLLNVRDQLLAEPSRQATAALAHFRKFCPSVTENTIQNFLAGSDDMIEAVRQWASVRVRLTLAESQQLWNSIVQHLKRIKTITARSSLPHVIRLSGAHLFACSDEIPHVLECETATNMLSLAAPYCLLWNLPQLLSREGLFALQRVAKHVESEDVVPLAIELPPEFSHQVVSVILGGNVDAVPCLVFCSVAAQDAALKQLVEVCLHGSSLHDTPKRHKCGVSAYRLQLAAALVAGFPIDETSALKVLALDGADLQEPSWTLLGELGCLAEILAQCPDIRALPMLFNAMAKGASVAAREAIAIMGLMVQHPDRRKFLKDINLVLWRTNSKPTFALVLILSVFGLQKDKATRTEAFATLVTVLQHLRNVELQNIIIGFIAAIVETAAQPQITSIATFFVQAYVVAEKDSNVALEAARRAGGKFGLRVAADIVFQCFENAFESANVVACA